MVAIIGSKLAVHDNGRRWQMVRYSRRAVSLAFCTLTFHSRNSLHLKTVSGVESVESALVLLT